MKRRVFLSVCAAVIADAQGSNKLSMMRVSDLAGSKSDFQLKGHITAVIFISAVCPISNDYNDRMGAIYRDYTSKSVQVVFVNANSNEKPEEVIEHAKAA